MQHDAPLKKKYMTVTCLQGSATRKISWYDPTPGDAITGLLRTAFSLSASQQFMLTDEDCSPIAISSAIPSGGTFELVLVPDINVRRAVVVVDPVSTGAVLSHQLVHKRGLEVICVWSDVVPDELKSFVAHGMEVPFAGRIQHRTGELGATAAAVRALDMQVLGVIVGCETGVLLGDMLSEALGVRTNGTQLSELRRNKFLQTEAVRKANLNACSQMLATEPAHVEAFLRQPKPTPFKAVVKPVEGAGSDGVSICYSEQEVRDCFNALVGTQNVLGLTNTEVLLQEYLSGDEYVVDSVSRNGVHKCVAIWKYDKRRFNGAPFVYFGMRFLPIDAEPQLRSMVEYIFGVLDALGIRNGAIHSEVKIEERGPVLIEANCRLHGGEGTWAPMAEACLGYSAVSAMLDGYLDPMAFAAIPAMPISFRAHAKEAKIRSGVAGTLVEIDAAALKAIRSLGSYQSEMVAAAVGKRVEKTIDLLTSYGNVNLVNESLEQLEADYKAFHEIVGRGIFKVA